MAPKSRLSPAPWAAGQSRAARTRRGVQQRGVRGAQLQQISVSLVQQEVQEVCCLFALRRVRRRQRVRLVAGLACAISYTLTPVPYLETWTLGVIACNLSGAFLRRQRGITFLCLRASCFALVDATTGRFMHAIHLVSLRSDLSP